MSQKQDTLARARKHARQVESQNRKMLRKRMNEYNVLSRAGAGFYDSDNSSPDTIHDITQRLEDKIRSTRTVFQSTSHIRHTRSEVQLMKDVVCDEVREVWLAKLSLHQSLDDVSRQKLIAQSRNTVDTNKPQIDITRELRLDALARAAVFQWCEGEGFDPDKIRPKLLRRIKYNESQRLF